MSFKANRRADIDVQRLAAKRLARALGVARDYAQEIVRYDTGDLHDSIRVIEPRIEGERVVSGLAAGGTFGEKRQAPIHYGMIIEENYPYIRPAMLESGWENHL